MALPIREGDIPGIQLRARRRLAVDCAEAWRWLTERDRLERWLADRVEVDARPARRSPARARHGVGSGGRDRAGRSGSILGTRGSSPFRRGGSALGGGDAARAHSARRRSRLRSRRAAGRLSPARDVVEPHHLGGVPASMARRSDASRRTDGMKHHAPSAAPRSSAQESARQHFRASGAQRVRRNARTSSARCGPRVDPEPLDARQVADEMTHVLHLLEDAVAIADQHRGLAQAVGILRRVRDQEIAGIEARRAPPRPVR